MMGIFSAGLWLLLLLALTRCFWSLGHSSLQRRLGALWLLLVPALAVPFYFRPHEELLGGTEAGACANTAATFARTGHLSHTDPLLARIPESERAAFLLGGAGPGQTKDACLWVKNLHTAELGPWFQPAYAVWLSLPLKYLPAWCVLYGAPLLAVLTAAALALLGVQLFGSRRGGILTAIFLLANPMVLWLGRSSCAEWGALLFFWLGLALVAHAWRSPGERHMADFALGALCLMVAPFFHISAWFGILPVGGILLVKAALGRRLFILIVPIMTVGFLAFLWHVAQVTDPHHLLPYLQPLNQHPGWVFAAALAVLLALSTLCSRLTSSTGPGRPLADRHPDRFALVLWLALLVIGLCPGLREHLPLVSSSLSVDPGPTDVQGWPPCVSRSALWAAWAGWGAWLFRKGAHADLRLGSAAILLPGLLLSGSLQHYALGARQGLFFWAPVMALCLAALVLWVWEHRQAWSRPVAVVVAALLLVALWHGRTHVAERVGCAGLYRTYEKLAAPVQAAKGWLLVEYSPLAAPMEHMFAVPTLALDTVHHASAFPVAEAAWEHLMRINPRQACFFLTPFHPPYSERFVFALEQRLHGAGPAMAGGPDRLPDQIVDRGFALSLYRMALRTPADTEHENPELNQALRPDASNFGLHGFSQLQTAPWPVHGLAVPADTEVPIPLDGETTFLQGDDLYFIFYGSFRQLHPPHLLGNFTGIHEVKWLHLTDDWWVLRLHGQITAARSFRIHSTTEALLTDVQVLRDGTFQSLATGWATNGLSVKVLPPLRARWTLPEASFTMPAPRGATGDLMLYLAAPPAATVSPFSLRVAGRGTDNQAPRHLVPGDPRWYIFRAAAIGFTPTNHVVTLTTAPPLHGNAPGLPRELGVLLGYAVVTD